MRGRALALLVLTLAATLLAACETTPNPVLRGAGSEHHQSFRVGLPF